ncbi:hypothetical protein BDV11DRAFT_27283 [Aspergillus similis]
MARHRFRTTYFRHNHTFSTRRNWYLAPGFLCVLGLPATTSVFVLGPSRALHGFHRDLKRPRPVGLGTRSASGSGQGPRQDHLHSQDSVLYPCDILTSA